MDYPKYFCVVRIYVFIILLFAGTMSSAQIVNIENQRLMVSQEGWTGSFGLNLSYVKNTNEIWQAGGRFRVQYHKGRHTGLWLSEINFIKAGESNFLNNGFEHLRYNYEIQDSGRLVFEAFRQMQYNKVQKIRLRSLFGAGLRYAVIDQDSAQVNIGVLPMLEFEDLTTNENNRHLRLSSYLSFDFQFNQFVGVNSITYWQPDILNFKDFRMSNETSLRSRITKNLELRLIFRVTYDERPPEGIPNNTVYLLNGINYRF